MREIAPNFARFYHH